jgi:quercetin dioxygenase-like cupin family protein
MRVVLARELDILSSLTETQEDGEMIAAHAHLGDDTQGWHTLTNRHTGERLRMRRIVHDGAMCLELKSTLPPRRDGPPLHVHFDENEEGTVVAGTLGAEVDGRQLQVEAGGPVQLPRGSAHPWWNAGDDTLVLECIVRPLVDLDVFLASVFEVLNSGPAKRPPLFYLAHLAWRHRKTQAALVPPRWAQSILIPCVVLVGTILGRYRGTEWLGCPARCAPAPLAHGPDGMQERRRTAECA